MSESASRIDRTARYGPVWAIPVQDLLRFAFVAHQVSLGPGLNRRCFVPWSADLACFSNWSIRLISFGQMPVSHR